MKVKITLYLVPEDDEGYEIKEFLIKNNLPFEEIVTDNLKLLSKIAHFPMQKKTSLLEIRYSHAVHVIDGFIKKDLDNLLEHIEKYNIKLRRTPGEPRIAFNISAYAKLILKGLI